jgi:type I restriction enzyme, R subunit
VLTHYRIAEADADAITLGGDDVQPLIAITGDGTGGGAGEIPMSLLGELVDLFNERYGAELGEVGALKVMTDVRDNVREENPDLADQAEANSRDDFVRERDNLLIGAALAVGGDRERQATLLKALLDDEDFRVRVGS